MKNDKIDKIVMDVPLFIRMLEFAKEDAKTDMDLHTATKNILKLSKQKKFLTMNDYEYIVKIKKEVKEMDASSSGSYEGALNAPMIKRKINKIPNYESKKGEYSESTDASSSGSYDVPLFGDKPSGRKNPLSIDGVKSINKSRAVNDPKFPKWGGPGGKFIKIKEKCKKFPYCNQGDINAIEELRESIEFVSKKYNIPKTLIENIILNKFNETN